MHSALVVFLTDTVELRGTIEKFMLTAGYRFSFDEKDMAQSNAVVVVYYEALGPAMNILTELRGDARPWRPVVFLAPGDDSDKIHAAYTAGADVVLKRPVKLPELRLAIEALLRLLRRHAAIDPAVTAITTAVAGKSATRSAGPADLHHATGLELPGLKGVAPKAIVPQRLIEDVNVLAELNLSSAESYVYAKINGVRNIKEVAVHSELGPEATLEVIRQLLQRGAIRLVRI
ncbi:response regulator transcription factor [bacterium]|nr:response regulator transcription factor [candidate division CSSED10-310 bacterium]